MTSDRQDVSVNLTFGRNYECEVLRELSPAEYDHLELIPPGTPLGHDGLMVRVSPHRGRSWVGVFSFGPGRFSQVLSLPDPDRLCVVSRGVGYLVRADDPSRWEEIDAVPVTGTRSVPAAGIVVFASDVDLLALDASGARWRTLRLSWDGLEIGEVTDGRIAGTYRDLETGSLRSFEVDLASGTAKGGVIGGD